MQWIKLTDRMPNPDEHGRVLIYTDGHDFNGEQVFDVKVEMLNECFYDDPDDQPEVCRVASHWMQHPSSLRIPGTLERVIAEQQKEIDRLRSMVEHNTEAWQRENKAVERVALAAFGVLNHPESPECHFELKQAVMAMGFCPCCEWRPCECGDHYDD